MTVCHRIRMMAKKKAKKKAKKNVYSALQVAKICGVVNQTAINWIKNSHLKAFRTPGGQYRIYIDDLIDFLEFRKMRIPKEIKWAVKKRSGTKIVIVDDDKELNDMLKELFTKKIPGADIIQAFNGFEAGRLISEDFSGIVILDINLPGISGYDLCKQIKGGKSPHAIVVIAISGLHSSEVEEKILSEGADAFFRKPFDFDKLVKTISVLRVNRRAG